MRMTMPMTMTPTRIQTNRTSTMYTTARRSARSTIRHTRRSRVPARWHTKTGRRRHCSVSSEWTAQTLSRGCCTCCEGCRVLACRVRSVDPRTWSTRWWRWRAPGLTNHHSRTFPSWAAISDWALHAFVYREITMIPGKATTHPRGRHVELKGHGRNAVTGVLEGGKCCRAGDSE